MYTRFGVIFYEGDDLDVVPKSREVVFKGTLMKKICIIVVFGRLLVDKKRERSFKVFEKERSIDRLETLWSWCLNKKKKRKKT